MSGDKVKTVEIIRVVETTYEPWERKAVLFLSLKFLAAGFLGTLVCVFVAKALHAFGWGNDFSTDILFVPWAVILVLGTQTAFHRGVVDEFKHVAGDQPVSEEMAKKRPHEYVLEKWEKRRVWGLTFKCLFASVIGTLALLGLTETFSNIGWHEIPSEWFFIPWAVIWISGASTAYHHGVLAKRRELRGRRAYDRRLGPRRQSDTEAKQDKTKKEVKHG